MTFYDSCTGVELNLNRTSTEPQQNLNRTPTRISVFIHYVYINQSLTDPGDLSRLICTKHSEIAVHTTSHEYCMESASYIS